MNIVFIHGNYPAQFRHLAEMLGRSGDHRVIFLTERNDDAMERFPGVEIRQIEQHRSINPGTHHYLLETEEAILKGQAVLRALDTLLTEGCRPRLVVTHGGTGLGLFIKDLLPDAVHVALFEWFFRPETAHWLKASYDVNDQLKTRIRNLPQLQELSSCDLAVVPTQWQKQQFPEEYQHKLEVIFDGINRSFFQPKPEIDTETIELIGESLDQPLILKPDDRVLSYATRGMETLRGFPQFLIAAVHALQCNPGLQVIIAGRDRRAYSYDAPSHDGSWKQHLLAQLEPFEGRERLHFTGLMPYVPYRSLLQRSNLHCYFTRPYVTSWSLFEAAACGARLCVNQTAATTNVVADPDTVNWVDLDDQQALNNTIASCLNKPLKRSELAEGYELSDCLQNWSRLVNRLLEAY